MVNIFWPFDFTDKRSLCWHGWIVEIFNVLIPKKIRTRLLPPPPLHDIVRIAMNIDIYGRSLTVGPLSSMSPQLAVSKVAEDIPKAAVSGGIFSPVVPSRFTFSQITSVNTAVQLHVGGI